MSIESEIIRISNNVQSTLDILSGAGITVPSGANCDNLPDLVGELAGAAAGIGVCTVEFDGTCKLYNIGYCQVIDGVITPKKVYAAGVTNYTLENVAAQGMIAVGVNANGGVTVGSGVTDLGVLYSTSRLFAVDTADGSTVTITIASA